ncbi:MAG: 2-aminoethylphosphonate--pyruvate transaminase [Candidatus Margulisbacteria bacterium]|nr:2-aminoethylphosphonate--pyruvate transaminase [Candidatus Margulisiibacteriota bacterium]
MTSPIRHILLNPGPATTTDTVKQAQIVSDICPREAAFGDIMAEISHDLTQFVGDPAQNTAVLFGGSGTAVIEAMLSSVVGEGTLLVINNGAYGKRMVDIAKPYGITVVDFVSSFVEPIDYATLEKAVQENPGISHLAVVHHETTTGLLHDLTPLGHFCSKHDITLMVDAMSSYGAVPIGMKAMNISYLAASSNKNIQGMAGVGFVVCDNQAIETLKDQPPRSYYLDLYQQYRGFKTHHQMRFTPPVQVLYALRQAIAELKQEGVATRYKRYQACWEVLVSGLANLNLTYIVDKAHHSRLITAIHEPNIEGYAFEEMHDYLYERDITIYPGKLKETATFRIANIGDLYPKDITLFLKHLEAYLKTL